jgi:Predicted sugar kinase
MVERKDTRDRKQAKLHLPTAQEQLGKETIRGIGRRNRRCFTLEYEIRGKNSKIVSGRAINDIVIHSNDYRVLGITAFINNKKNYFYSDGVIVSSAIGSTGYAYSAGGKRLKHTSRLMQFVPIAPYRRKFSPITLRPTDRLKIKADRTCAFILDGIYIKELKPNETVIIKQGRALKFFKGVGWYEER